MIIAEIHLESNRVLSVVSEDGRMGTFDISPYLKYEAFGALRDINEFRKVSNGRYFVEWACGADLSADTIEAKWLLKTGKHNNRKKSLQSKHAWVKEAKRRDKDMDSGKSSGKSHKEVMKAAYEVIGCKR